MNKKKIKKYQKQKKIVRNTIYTIIIIATILILFFDKTPYGDINPFVLGLWFTVIFIEPILNLFYQKY